VAARAILPPGPDIRIKPEPSQTAKTEIDGPLRAKAEKFLRIRNADDSKRPGLPDQPHITHTGDVERRMRTTRRISLVVSPLVA
jgi:hypothetical protein